jgi:hypothetical protein
MRPAQAPVSPDYADVVDIVRYPIHDLGSEAGQSFLAHCRAALVEKGVCELSGFLTGDAVSEMVKQGTSLSDKGFHTDNTHTIYFEPVDETVPVEHPTAALQCSAKKAIAYDCLPADAPIRRLYESPDMTKFVAAVLGKDVLYPSADPLDALEIAVFADGDELGWHFDRSEFSVTVMYQQSDEGGEFEYFPGLRSETSESYQSVQKVLQGDLDGMVRLPSGRGSLAIFRGQHALHRVTPIAGNTPRINSVLTYGERPDMKLNELTQQLFYGRTA